MNRSRSLNAVQLWIDNVAYAHSRSRGTELNYKRWLRRYCKYIGETPEEILVAYEGMNDRDFRRKYARLLKGLIAQLMRNNYAVGSIRSMVAVIRSFFKYNDLPLGMVPMPRKKSTYHNRDITSKEIAHILRVSKPRERAFYVMMAQGGFRPDTLSNLKLKHMQPDFKKGIIPCKVKVPEELTKGEFGSYFTFIGEESINYLKAYLHTRGVIGNEDNLFSSRYRGKSLNPGSASKIFRQTVRTLKDQGIVDFERAPYRKPSELRMYNLRKFFRKHAGQAGIDYVNFWMGHRTDYGAQHIPASDAHYFSRDDVEFHRKIYATKAMPHLRIESLTPSETDRILSEQQKEIDRLREKTEEMRLTVEQLKRVDQDMKDFLRETAFNFDKKLKRLEELSQREYDESKAPH